MNRWKKSALAVAAIVAAGGLAAYVFRKALFMLVLATYLRPDVPFDAAKVPPAPDYADPASWVALPSVDDPSDWLPADYVEVENPLRDSVDVFYVHPTGFFGTHNWNAAMHERSEPGIPTGAMLASQASAFNGMGKVYAPEYRQATLYSFIEPEREPGKTNGHQALDLAYSDVARAFDHFITHFNQGRPFVLASHSQGTCHALRLVAEKIDGTDLHKRMVAAYLVGFGVPMDYFEKVYTTVKPGTAPGQTGCVLTWDTLRLGEPPEIGGFHRYPGGWESAKGKPRLIVNPLSWTTDEVRAEERLNKGALVTDMGSLRAEKVTPGMLIQVVPGQTWAQRLGDGLYVKDLSGTAFDTMMSANGNYHLFDYHLFWVNIREDAAARAQAWIAAQAPSAPASPTPSS